MKIWYDACTGKHIRYGVAIAKKVRDAGHEVVLTTRKHPDTLAIAEFLGEKFIVVGRYNPKSLFSRLKEGTKRQLSFCKIFGKNTFDVAVSHGSTDQCRVAFGLGKPIICTVDTPYAEAVHRLTLPLADYIVTSKAIPKKILQVYNVKGKIISFDGVDEVAWIKDFKPKIQYNFGKPLIVVRQLEEKAVYTKETVDMAAIARKLRKLGNVLFLSRYHHKKIKGLTILEEFVDSASLMAQADLFIGAGGTITREAALQGTPAIIVNVFRNQHVNDFLARKGFPIFKTEASKVLRLAEKVLGEKKDVKHLLAELENPADVIAKIVEKLAKKENN